MSVPQPTTVQDLVALNLEDPSCSSEIQARGLNLTDATTLNADWCNNTATDVGTCCDQCTANAVCQGWFWIPQGITSSSGVTTCQKACLLKANLANSAYTTSDTDGNDLEYYSGFNCGRFNCSSVPVLATLTRLPDSAQPAPAKGPAGVAPSPAKSTATAQPPRAAPAAGVPSLAPGLAANASAPGFAPSGVPSVAPTGATGAGTGTASSPSPSPGAGSSPALAPTESFTATTQSSSNTGAIIGGAVGGGVALALLLAALVLFFCCYRAGRGLWAGRRKKAAVPMHPHPYDGKKDVGFSPAYSGASDAPLAAAVGYAALGHPASHKSSANGARTAGGLIPPEPVLLPAPPPGQPADLYRIPSTMGGDHLGGVPTEDFDYRTPDTTMRHTRGSSGVGGVSRRASTNMTAQDSVGSLTHPRGHIPDIMSSASTLGGGPNTGSLSGDRLPTPTHRLSHGSGRSAGSASLGSIEWEVRADQLEFCKLPDGRDHILGVGAFGQVYKALMNGVTPVAVKILMHKETPKEAEKFPREVAILRACHDRHVVSLLGVCQESRTMLITEYCGNGDLWRAIGSDNTGQYLWYGRGRAVALDVARGLVYLHSKGIVHFDLKTPNILLDDNFTAKIADVGLSKLMQRTVTVASAMGTFAWAAPEQILGQPCSEKADMWSFGIILWEIITGEHPRGRSMRPVRVPDECPKEVAELFLACTNPDAEKRPSARQAYEVLHNSPRSTQPPSI